MKKFTKICLAIALITFLLGCLLGGVGIMLGGLRQMEHVTIEHLQGIPFRFVRNGHAFSFGFWNDRWDDWEDDWEWESREWKKVEMSEIDQSEDAASERHISEEAAEHGKDGEGHKSGQAGTEQMVTGQKLGLTAATLRGLDLEIGAGTVYVRESENDSVSISITGECEEHYRYRFKDGGSTLMLAHKDMTYDDFEKRWNRNHPKGNTRIYLYLPKEASLDAVNIDFGAGILEAEYLKASEIEIYAGAGDCHFEGLEASEYIDITMGAGKLTADQLIARETKLDIAAGELYVNGMRISQEAKITVSMGNAAVNGAFEGEMDVECSMGNLDLILEGTETDYNYEFDCGMGEVKIGAKNYGGWADKELLYGSPDTLDITCSMGNVNVMFTE